jgi:hypothetical protein
MLAVEMRLVETCVLSAARPWSDFAQQLMRSVARELELELELRRLQTPGA